MIAEDECKSRLRDWVFQNSKKDPPEPVNNGTMIIEEKVISSVQILDLVLFLENIAGISIDLGVLRPGSFKNVDTIYQVFVAKT